MAKTMLICGTVLAIAGTHFDHIDLYRTGLVVIGIALFRDLVNYLDRRPNV
ncbi:hypothetical protein RIVERRIDER_6 [Xanthomonas phage RiverRider]|uniref:Holin n=1 Tax=Xanthomonas phage RiverRider TaxID=2108116 RepID=A0A2P1JUT2_9CAUD|nr:hypothetical protein HWB58_gp06 [Xanthomonas phage RiverRider]AVO23094.1 hypothetical protein RIVERRIDER_6 [Xanthomonas phage RiverRider]